MTEWSEDELMAQGYYTNPDPNLDEQNAIGRQIERNAQHRESLLPCSRSAGQPIVPAEPVTPRTEAERLLRPGLAWRPEAKPEDARLIRLEEWARRDAVLAR